jgi:hypothetical protein
MEVGLVRMEVGLVRMEVGMVRMESGRSPLDGEWRLDMGGPSDNSLISLCAIKFPHWHVAGRDANTHNLVFVGVGVRGGGDGFHHLSSKDFPQ